MREEGSGEGWLRLTYFQVVGQCADEKVFHVSRKIVEIHGLSCCCFMFCGVSSKRNLGFGLLSWMMTCVCLLLVLSGESCFWDCLSVVCDHDGQLCVEHKQGCASSFD